MKQIVSRIRLFEAQQSVFRNDDGLDFVIAGVGGGKTVVAGNKTAFWGLRHPRQRDGSPTEWLVLGRDYRLVREIQLEEILKAFRNMAYVGEPEEVKVEGGDGDRSARAWVFTEGGRELRASEPFPHSPVAGRVERWLEGDCYLVRRFHPIPERAIVKRAIGGTDPCVELVTGVIFRGFSSTDLSRMRGFGFTGGWIDEAEYQSEEALDMAMNRQRAGQVRRLIVTTSPEVAGRGWVYRVISGKFPRWDPLRATTKLRVHRWGSADNPTNTPEQLAALRAVMEAVSPGKAAGELDGLFVGTEEAPGVGPIDYARAFVGRATLTAEDVTADVLGVDIGETQDFTWLTVLSRTGVVLAMERFNVSTPGVPRQGFYPYLEERIERLAAQWAVRKLVIDAAKAGIGIVQHLEQRLRGIRDVQAYRTDAPGKKTAAVEALGVALARRDIRVPNAWRAGAGDERIVEHSDYLRRELSELMVVEIGPGRRRFDHPEGGHDDGIVSLALAWHGLQGVQRGTADISGWGTIDLGPRSFGSW